MNFIFVNKNCIPQVSYVSMCVGSTLEKCSFYKIQIKFIIFVEYIMTFSFLGIKFGKKALTATSSSILLLYGPGTNVPQRRAEEQEEDAPELGNIKRKRKKTDPRDKLYRIFKYYL